MASSSGAPLASRDTPWESEYPPLPDGVAPAVVPYERIEVLNSLKPYSIRNGPPEEIEPYFLTSAIPTAYHWVPINGLAPSDSMSCVDGFMRSYVYHLTKSAVPGATVASIKKAAMILGVTRAVMTTNFDLTKSDINAKEMAAPVLSVSMNGEGKPVYTVLVSGNDQNIQLLTTNVGLSDEELEVVKVLARCAHAIIPIQGLNLITDGHHYLSEKSKQSYKAFLGVERQIWAPRAFKDWIAGSEDLVRDLMWHKAGHPVAVSLKEAAATDPQVKANLENAKLGSASARLPALEPGLRAADTYLKLAEAIGAIWSTMGGNVDCEVLRFRVSAVKTMARGSGEFTPAFDMGDGVMVKSRSQAIEVLKATVVKNANKAALLYGFYCSMVDMNTEDMTGATGGTLKAAYSLKKLRTNNIASYLNGMELYRDYRAMAARRSADRKMPQYVFEP